MDVTYPPPTMYQPNVPVCGCDRGFQSQCAVHILNASVRHLIALFSDMLSSCCFCTILEDDAQRKVNNVYNFFSGNYIDEILPAQCVSLVTY